MLLNSLFLKGAYFLIKFFKAESPIYYESKSTFSVHSLPADTTPTVGIANQSQNTPDLIHTPFNMMLSLAEALSPSLPSPWLGLSLSFSPKLLSRPLPSWVTYPFFGLALS